MKIKVDDLSGSEIICFLEAHMKDMMLVSPPESRHALDLAGLKKTDITFWSVWQKNTLVGCGALKALNESEAEIKSMRTASSARGKGVASTLLEHILKTCQDKGYQTVNLETGSMDFFAPARHLYTKYGFTPCPPFAAYTKDPNSVYMSRQI
ncbi:MAG: GNAT family N-acetyltransferase [Arenicellales bacterium]